MILVGSFLYIMKSTYTYDVLDLDVQLKIPRQDFVKRNINRHKAFLTLTTMLKRPS